MKKEANGTTVKEVVKPLHMYENWPCSANKIKHHGYLCISCFRQLKGAGVPCPVCRQPATAQSNETGDPEYLQVRYRQLLTEYMFKYAKPRLVDLEGSGITGPDTASCTRARQAAELLVAIQYQPHAPPATLRRVCSSNRVHEMSSGCRRAIRGALARAACVASGATAAGGRAGMQCATAFCK